MAGKKNHVVPRLLQKRFATRIQGKKSWVQLYRKSVVSREVSTRNWQNIEKYYWDSDGSLADDKVTEYEPVMLALLNRLHSMGGEPVDVPEAEIAVMISHLEVRSANFRLMMEALGGRLFSEIDRIFGNEAQLSLAMAAQSSQNLDIYEKAKRELISEGIPKAMIDTLSETLDLSKEIAEICKIAAPRFKQQLAEKINVPSILKNAQLEILKERGSATCRQKNYCDLQYSVKKYNLGNLILPDCKVVFYTRSGARASWDDFSLVDGLVLPLSSDTLLIGQKRCAELDLENLLEDLASCARDSFISNEKRSEHQRLSEVISKNSDMFSQIEMDEMFKELRSELLEGETSLSALP